MTYRYYEFPKSIESEAVAQNVLALAAERNIWAIVERDHVLTRVTVELFTGEDKMLFSLLAEHCDEY